MSNTDLHDTRKVAHDVPSSLNTALRENQPVKLNYYYVAKYYTSYNNINTSFSYFRVARSFGMK